MIWAWFKKNWKTVLLGVCTLGVGLLFGRLFRKPPVVVAPELVEAEEVASDAADKRDAEIAEAKQELDAEVAKVLEEHAKGVNELSAEQQQRVSELAGDPDALNAYLIQVGKDLRDE